MDYEKSYLVPSNAKKGMLIFNIFRPFDLIIFGTGIATSFIFLMIVSTSNIFFTILACLPGAICSLLVIPIPNYHNTLEALKSIYGYYTGRRKYIWKGWCIYERFINENSKK